MQIFLCGSTPTGFGLDSSVWGLSSTVYTYGNPSRFLTSIEFYVNTSGLYLEMLCWILTPFDLSFVVGTCLWVEDEQAIRVSAGVISVLLPRESCALHCKLPKTGFCMRITQQQRNRFSSVQRFLTFAFSHFQSFAKLYVPKFEDCHLLECLSVTAISCFTRISLFSNEIRN